MKRIIILVMYVFLTSSAFAQERNFTAAVGSGVSLPRNPDNFEDLWFKGINISGGLYYSLNNLIKVGIQSGQYDFGFDSNKFKKQFSESSDVTADVTVSGSDASVFIFMPSVRLTAPSLERFVPFVQAGLGYFRSNIDAGEVQVIIDDSRILLTIPGDKEFAFGYMAGGGVEVTLNNRSSLVLELGLIVGQTEDEVTTLLPLEFKYLFRL